jgi:hypothetical protein
MRPVLGLLLWTEHECVTATPPTTAYLVETHILPAPRHTTGPEALP